MDWIIKIRDTFLEVLIIWIRESWGLYWGPLILGNYHMGCALDMRVFPKSGFRFSQNQGYLLKGLYGLNGVM